MAISASSSVSQTKDNKKVPVKEYTRWKFLSTDAPLQCDCCHMENPTNPPPDVGAKEPQSFLSFLAASASSSSASASSISSSSSSISSCSVK